MEYWKARRMNALFRRAQADAQQRWTYLLTRQCYRCAITGLPLEKTSDLAIHHIVPKQAGGSDDWDNLCLVLKSAEAESQARLGTHGNQASLKDVPFSGV